VVAAGLLYGLVEAASTTWLGSSATQIVTFSAVILALAFAPAGLFTRARRVRV
jgi:branched-chain amino acid transport system permease protein